MLLAVTTVCLLGAGPGWDQVFPDPIDFSRPLTMVPVLDFSAALTAASDTASSTRSPKVPLFRTPTGMVGLTPDDDSTSDETAAIEQVNDSAFGEDNRLQIDFGTDNPYFDFRRPGTVGGIGYYKLQGEYQLLDGGSTGLSLSFRGITPAGVDSDGVANGPTLFVPGVAWYQELSGLGALQGYIGKTMHADYRLGDNLNSGVQYGMAYQRPVWVPANDNSVGSVHLFVQALGYYRCGEEFPQRNVPNWELLPGLHFRGGDNWWLSGGMIVPVGQARTESGLWQVTCSWRY